MPKTTEEEITDIHKDIAKLKEDQEQRAKWRQRIAYVGWLAAGLAIGVGFKEWKDIPQQITATVAAEVADKVPKEVNKVIPSEVRARLDGYVRDAYAAKTQAEEAASSATAAFGGNLKRINNRILVGEDNVIQILFPDRGRLQLENSSALQYLDEPRVGGPGVKNTLLWARPSGFNTVGNAKPN